MAIRDILMSAGGGEGTLYVDDVFSTYTYTGNNSTQTINNGIDLTGKGGLVWVKNRTRGTSGHALFDTNRTSTYFITPSGHENYITSTEPEKWNSSTSLAFTSSGFTLDADTPNSIVNYYINPYVSWTFRQAPKFFDIITYVGDGTSFRVLPHSLNNEVGLVIVKATSTTGNWLVNHRNISSTKSLFFNSTAGITNSDDWGTVPTTNSTLTLGLSTGLSNLAGVTYVAYLFAHDTSTDGIIQCGSFTTDFNGVANVTLGWEPQFLLIKMTDSTSDWTLLDTSRGLPIGTGDAKLLANLASTEVSANLVDVNATGFITATNGLTVTQRNFIYIAIRRPNKPPTSGTQVYNAIARTGTGAAATVTGVGFAPDLAMAQKREGNGAVWYDRLRGATRKLKATGTTAEVTEANALIGFDMNGVALGEDTTSAEINQNTSTFINHFFKRAPGVFDEVCWTGNSITGLQLHSLGVKPELLIMKSRTGVSDWETGVLTTTNDHALRLNTTAAAVSGATNTVSVGTNATQFSATLFSPFYVSGISYVAYLFATKAGISKVGSYTGNGSSQTIACGFATGARFVLIKRIDSTGDWYVWDTVRGIITGNDPHLSLNSTVAEVTTDDSINPDASGFIVNQLAATNINVTAASYIFLAIA